MDYKNKLNNPPARVSLPFFINLDVEVEKEWESLDFFSRIHRFQHTSVMLTLRDA